MPAQLEEFINESIAKLLKRMPLEKRLEGLSPSERLQGLSPEERRAALEELQRGLDDEPPAGR